MAVWDLFRIFFFSSFVAGESSVASFVEKLKKMRRREDGKQDLVVAWGAWGVVAGRPGQAVNRGKAPCLGGRPDESRRQGVARRQDTGAHDESDVLPMRRTLWAAPHRGGEPTQRSAVVGWASRGSGIAAV